jgi:WD40 repeat protein
LPASPNSFVFNRQGTKAYLGTDLGLFGTKGLMVFDAATPGISQFPSIVGKVLAVSPDGTKVLVADTKDPNAPKQVFVFDTASGSWTSFPISATVTGVAADFSPDSLKAFIVTTDSANAGVLYVYSKLDALQTIPLSGPANDVAFLPEGGFGYIAGGAASAVSILPTCDNPAAAQSEITTSGTNGTPQLLRALPDGGILALTPPGIDILTPTVTGSGCAFPRPPAAPVGNLAVTNSVASFGLGQGNFIPRQLIISTDGSTAYIIADNTSSQPLGTILTFNISNQTSPSIALAGNAVPLQASLTPDAAELYVGASDGTVHVINTVVGGDFAQISFPQGAFNTLCPSLTPNTAPPASCNADLVAVRP